MKTPRSQARAPGPTSGARRDLHPVGIWLNWSSTSAVDSGDDQTMKGDLGAEGAAVREEAVRASFDAMPIMVVAMEGPEHRLVAMNRAWREFTGRPFIGRLVRELSLDAQALLPLLDVVYRTGEPTAAQRWRVKFINGRDEPVDTFLDFVITPWRWDDGRVRGVLLTQQESNAPVLWRSEEERTVEAERRYEAARKVVIELQEAMLPQHVPVLPGVSIAAQYLVAAHDQKAGGDWFDVLVLPDGSIGVVVGDVVGHGIAASAAMGQLRAVFRQLMLDYADLATVIERVDQMVVRSPTMRAATVTVGLLEPDTGNLVYSTCGHPAPLVAEPRGASRYLPITGGMPLGTGGSIAVANARLGPDELLLLYSDGLIERRGIGLSEGQAILAEVVTAARTNGRSRVNAASSTADLVCRQTVEMLTSQGLDDDVTVLAVHRRARPIPALRCELLASPALVGQVRTLLHEWLERLGLQRNDEQAIHLVVNELVANCVEHAYPADQPGPVWIDVELGVDGMLLLQVRDRGAWREAAEPATSGRGLWLAGAVVDHLQVHHANGDRSGATKVVARHRLQQPATLASGTGHRARSREALLDYASTLSADVPHVLRVLGPVDATSAARFANDIDTASRGGVLPLIIDLCEVDLLASAALRVLFATRDRNRSHGRELMLVATPGSVAAQVLDLVRLPYDSREG